MSVIAGCSLFKGIILLADCRVTISKAGNPDIYCDNAQKLFPLTPTTVLGFVGDVRGAAAIIRELIRQLKEKKERGLDSRLHPLVLARWLPRYLRFTYDYLVKKWKIGRVDFMAGSIVLDMVNTVERAKVVEIMERFRLGKLSAQRNWLPGILVDILRTAPDKKYVGLQGIPANLLYYMQPPNFIPYYLGPLEYTAIGSGKDVVVDINKNADWIFASEVGNSFVEAMALRETVNSFLEKHPLISVGGMFPAIKISGDGMEYLCYSSEIPVGGPKFSLSLGSNGRWIQQNNATGKEIRLLLPWEIDPKELQHDNRFDDLKDALQSLRQPKKDLTDQ